MTNVYKGCTKKTEEEEACEDGIGDWGDVAISQVVPGATRSSQRGTNKFSPRASYRNADMPTP